MAIQLFDYLNSINMTKKNLVRTAQDPSVEERSFPTFMGMRFLSYHEDALFLVNELNQVATVECGLTPQQHYEFLLHVLPKSKRFAKWQKSDKDEAIELVMSMYKYSYTAARDVVALLTDEDIRQLKELTGGQT
jgi:hypothetical protein